jgi:hypothetical protein
MESTNSKSVIQADAPWLQSSREAPDAGRNLDDHILVPIMQRASGLAPYY